MKKQIVAMLTCLMMCSVFVFSGFTSHAVIGQGDDMLDFYVPYSRPEGDGVGYISIAVEQNGIYKLETFVWFVQPFSEVDEFGSDFEACTCWVAINNNNLAIMIENTSPDVTFTCNLFTMYYSDTTGTRMDVLKSSILYQEDSGEDWIGYDLNYNNYNMNVIGYEIGGNAYLDSSSLNTGGKFYYPRIHWNNDGKDEIAILNKIFEELQYVSSATQNLIHIRLDTLRSAEALSRILDILQSNISEDEMQKQLEFESSSSTQTDELNSLNQQTQVYKPDVDTTAQSIDDNLNISTDANYGVLLSTITGNSNILTMLLVSVSVALISFVFFGKR